MIYGFPATSVTTRLYSPSLCTSTCGCGLLLQLLERLKKLLRVCPVCRACRLFNEYSSAADAIAWKRYDAMEWLRWAGHIFGSLLEKSRNWTWPITFLMLTVSWTLRLRFQLLRLIIRWVEYLTNVYSLAQLTSVQRGIYNKRRLRWIREPVWFLFNRNPIVINLLQQILSPVIDNLTMPVRNRVHIASVRQKKHPICAALRIIKIN